MSMASHLPIWQDLIGLSPLEPRPGDKGVQPVIFYRSYSLGGIAMSITGQLILAFCLVAPIAGLAQSDSKRREATDLLAVAEGPGSCRFTMDGKSQCRVTSRADCEKKGGSFVKEGTCKKK